MAKPIFKDVVNFGSSASSRFGARVAYAFGHTQEGNGDAYALAAYCRNPSNNASYHDIIDNQTRIAIVDTDMASWSVLNANSSSYNFCFAGSRASWSRQQWIDNMRNGIRIAAWSIVENAAKYKYLNPRLVQSRPYPKGNVACVADHYFVTKVLGIGTHTDLGPGFPFDLLESDIREHLSPANPAPVVNRINERAAKTDPKLLALGKRIATGNENKDGEVPTPDGKGRWAKFEHGYIYWSPLTGAVAIPNVLFDQWQRLKYERGDLGYPRTERTVLTEGLVQAFERGVLYLRSDSPDAFFVTGVIGARWAHDGYESGPLGWPTSNEIRTADGGRTQHFQYGSMSWHPSGATREITTRDVKVAIA